MRFQSYWGRGKTAKRIEDIVRLLIYAFLWGVLMVLQQRMHGLLLLIAYIGYSLLGLAWAWRMNLRLRDAGLPQWYGVVILCAPLFLLLVLVQLQVMGGPIALALFALTQTPIVFLRPKATSPASATPTEQAGGAGPGR